MSTKEIFVL